MTVYEDAYKRLILCPYIGIIGIYETNWILYYVIRQSTINHSAIPTRSTYKRSRQELRLHLYTERRNTEIKFYWLLYSITHSKRKFILTGTFKLFPYQISTNYGNFNYCWRLLCSLYCRHGNRNRTRLQSNQSK